MILFLGKLARKKPGEHCPMKKFVLTNTLSNKKEDVIIDTNKPFKMYVCGITPYDSPHIGHGRVYVVFDVVYRFLQFCNAEVTYCRNFTDIDDKLLNRAEKEFNDPMRYSEIATTYINIFENNMNALQCLKPTFQPRVTHHIPMIIDFIKGLIEKGCAYEVDGDVYFSIKAFSDYGKLSKRNVDDMMAGSRVSINEKKKDPLDFALWKSEPEGSFWQSPWGYGRPGWHIECSALSAHYLGTSIDLHGGGMDLIFPHHENEIAQTEGLTNIPFARLWVHNAFVRINEEKMSKSLGNFITLDAIFKKYDPMILRFFILQHHYRNPLDFSYEELDRHYKTYQKLCMWFDGIAAADICTLKNYDSLDPITQECLDFVADDLNLSGTFGVIFKHSEAINADLTIKSRIKTILTSLLGLSLMPLAEKEVEITEEIQTLIDARNQARLNKDWKTADTLRDQLKALGYEARDGKLK